MDSTEPTSNTVNPESPDDNGHQSPILNNEQTSENLATKTLEEWDANRKALERMLNLGFRPANFMPTPPLLAAAFGQHPALGLATANGASPAVASLGALHNAAVQQHQALNNHRQELVDSPSLSVEPEDLSFKIDKSSPTSPGRDSTALTSGSSGEQAPDSTPQQNWSYEEQFKQLYDLNDDPKRKEWLDDWLSFMHKIGKPVTRIPIMAKQVLDLYELYRLVVSHGGLVEIIKKKLWREITKGLNLPSSITSAAFTLRTQYQKYLYDYECDKEHLSSPTELTKAIDENKREGRRQTQNFTPYSVPTSLLKHDDDSNNNLAAANGAALAAAVYRDQQLVAMETQRQLERAQRAAVEAIQKHQQQAVNGGITSLPLGGNGTAGNSGRASTSSHGSADGVDNTTTLNDQAINVDSGEPQLKRSKVCPNLVNPPPINEQITAALGGLFGGMSSAHIKMTSRGDQNFCGAANGGDNSLVVSMEINGVMYQGVLFALNAQGNTAAVPSAAGTSPTAPLRIHTNA